MKRLLPLVLALVSLVSCEGLDDAKNLSEASRGDLLSWEKTFSISAEKASDLATMLGEEKPFNFDVTCYKIVYRTVYKDKPIDASALVAIPDGVREAPLLAYYHATSFPEESGLGEAASAYRGKKISFQENNCVLPFASAGYFVVAPDYVGYGVSADVEHPFTYYPELSKGNIDALIAARQFLGKLSLVSGRKVFLTGWSQGAGAALAVQKYLESDYAADFDVVTSALSGPYDFTAFTEYIIDNPDRLFLTISLYAWSFYTLNHFSPHMGFPDDQVFRRNVYDQMSAIYSSNSTPRSIFNWAFLEGYKNGTNEAFIQAAEENVYSRGWVPRGKIFLHHGMADRIVPYFNSVSAKNDLGKTSDVTLYSYEGQGHLTLLDEYIPQTLKDFAACR